VIETAIQRNGTTRKRTRAERGDNLKSETPPETLPEAAPTTEGAPQTKTRPPLTAEQRERKNTNDRARRATLATAKAQANEVSDNHSAAPTATFEGTIAHQQAQRDRPFQQALGASLQAQDKARAARILISQQRQRERK